MALSPDTHVLVAGVTTRAIAASAARTGVTVTAIDAFADLDQHPGVSAHAVGDPFTPRAAAQASREIQCDAVAYASSFENHPDAVRTLACGRTLLGNTPDALRKVRNPHLLAHAFTRHHIATPALDGHGDHVWLKKPNASGGGTAIERWDRGMPMPEGYYLQEFIEGTSGSVAFVSSSEGVRVLGVFQQLIGLPSCGASGFRYCGSILDGRVAEASVSTMRAAAALAEVVTTEFELRGVNGIDFIARDGVLYPVEVNPRWTASMELVERAHGVSVFAAHAEACATGTLPGFDALNAPPIGRSIGKAVMFARHDMRAGDTTRWCDDDSVRDVPRPGTWIRTGEPVCTIFGEGSTPESCLAQLEERAAVRFDELRVWAGTP